MLVAALAGCSAPSADARNWWSHVQYLAADSLQGRNTGSAGHRKAAEYVAREFQRYGALPGGDDGWFQRVRFVSRRIHEDHSSLALVNGDRVTTLRLGE